MIALSDLVSLVADHHLLRPDSMTRPIIPATGQRWPMGKAILIVELEGYP